MTMMNRSRNEEALATILAAMPDRQERPVLPKLYRLEANGDLLSVVPVISGSTATFSMVRNGSTFYRNELPLSEAREAHDELMRRGFRKHVMVTCIPLP